MACALCACSGRSAGQPAAPTGHTMAPIWLAPAASKSSRDDHRADERAGAGATNATGDADRDLILAGQDALVAVIIDEREGRRLSLIHI